MGQAYLRIENPGVAPEEGFVLLGASTKRQSTNRQVVGMFGTGNSQSIGVCLRNGLSPIVFASNLRMEFGTRSQGLNDGLRDHTFNRVFVKFGGKDKNGVSRSSTEDLGYVLEHGAKDWVGVELALREFISNALDRAVEEGERDYLVKYINQQPEGFVDAFNNKESDEWHQLREVLEKYRKTAQDFKNVRVTVVDESKVRAKANTTRVFVPLTDAVLNFYNNLGKWFLHFSEPELLNQAILPKASRNLNGRRAAVIYRRGVRVREFQQSDVPSLYDYNLENLQLDESRKVDDWYVSYEAAKALADADVETVASVWQSFLEKGSRYWEHSFTDYGLNEGIRNTKQQETWCKAFDRVVGEMGVLAVEGNAEVASRKGYKVVTAPEAFVNAAAKRGVRTPSKVLSADERDGNDVIEPTVDGLAAVDLVWEVIERFNMTNGREKPFVKSFKKIMSAGSQTLGFYREGGVYINVDLTTGDPKAMSQQLLCTVIEEVAHHVTQAQDSSRDLQDFVFNLAAHLMRG